MDEQIYKQIIEQLSTLMNKMDNIETLETYDRIDNVKRELEKWYRLGAQGDLPNTGDLLEWGIEIESKAIPEVEVLEIQPPSEDELDQLLEDLAELAMETTGDEERTRLKQLRGRIKANKSAYLTSPIPDADLLAALGLWPKSEAVLKAVEAPRSENQIVMIAPQSTIVAEQPSQKEAEDIEAKTAYLITQARLTAEKYPDNFERQKDSWREVLKLNPKSDEAVQALEQIAGVQQREKLETQVKSIRERVRQAVETKNLFGLDAAISDYSGLKKQFSGDETGNTLQPLFDETEAFVNRARRDTQISLALDEADLQTRLNKFREIQVDNPDYPELNTIILQLEKDIENQVPQNDEPVETQKDSGDQEFLARIKMAAGNTNLHTAVTDLRTLVNNAPFSLKELVEKTLQEKAQDLEIQTQRLVERARSVSEKFPNDFLRQDREWREVLLVNPESEDANLALQNITLGRRRKEIEARLATMMTQAEDAGKADKEFLLNDMIAEIAGYQHQVKERTLPSDLLTQIEKTNEKVLALRNVVRQRLQILPTAILEGDFRTAFISANQFMSRGYPPRIVDEKGLLGSPGIEVDIQPFFRVISREFATQVKKKSSERLQMAKSQLKAEPGQALNWLNEAKGWLTDDALTTDLKSGMRDLLNDVEETIKEAGRFIALRQKMHNRIVEAKSARSAQERLNMLRLVQEEYPEYTGLPEQIKQAEGDLAYELAGFLSGEISKAQMKAEADQFDEAVELLNKSQSAVQQMIANPTADSPLGMAFARLADERDKIIRSNADNRYLDDNLRQINQYIANYNQKKENNQIKGNEQGEDLENARSLLDRLTDAQRRKVKVTEVELLLAALQGDSQNWKLGQSEYRSGRWNAANTYFEKIKPDYIQKTQADTFARKARAALFVEQAQIFEKDGNWPDALTRYQDAVELFKTGGEDEYTRSYHTAAKNGVLKITEIEKNNRPVREKLQQVRDMIFRAVEIAKQRENGLPLDKVDPIPGFAEASRILEEQQKIQSYYVGEIQDLLSNARKEWINAYIRGMQAVKEILDETLLQKAVERSEDLKKAGLLFDPTHKNLARDIQSDYLDIVYRNLTNTLDVDWNKVAENRRKRREMPDTLNETEVEDQLRTAIRNSMEAEVTRLTRDRKRESYISAQKFLSTSIENNGIARADQDLIKHLVKLYWQTQDWDAAHSATQLFIQIGNSEGRKTAGVWDKLTTVARDLSQNDINSGQIALFRLESEQSLLNHEKGEEMAKERQELLQNTLDRLVMEARAANVQATEEGYIKAAELYALAYNIDPHNPNPSAADDEVEHDLEVENGLKNLGVRIKPGFQRRLDRAKKLAIGNRDLDNAIKESDELYHVLQAISRVARMIGLSDNEKLELADIVGNEQDPNQPGKLGKTRTRWYKARSLLKDAETALQQALSLPLPLSDDGYGSVIGGWDFRQCVEFITEARQVAGQESDLLDIVERRSSDLSQKYEQPAKDLIEKVSPLMESVRLENFDDVIKHAEILEKAWNDLRRQNPAWNGLGILLEHEYLSGRVDKPLQHRDHARRQKENLSEWQRWYETVTKTNDKLEEIKMELENPLLGDLRDFKSLQQIVEDSSQAIRVCDDFLSAVGKRPTQKPLSQKAETIASQITDAQIEDIKGPEGFKSRMKKLGDDSRAARSTLEHPLSKLRIDIANVKNIAGDPPKKPVPEQRWKVAANSLEACEKIDRKHPEVVKYRDYLDNKIIKK